MKRTVSAHIELEILDRTNMVFSLSAGHGADLATENLRFSLDGADQEYQELLDIHGTRLHQFESQAGHLEVDYDATVTGRAQPTPSTELDLVTYLRPSRYCQSDTLTPTARGEFNGLYGHDLLEGVTNWVWERLRYVSGSSLPTDGATRTLFSRRGVCRDFAHVTIALLRAMEVPTRMVSVFAPGISPMDFHAVAEAWVDGEWWVVDATRRAPRQGMVRIATGRDAADTAWLTSSWSDISVIGMSVTAGVDVLPFDDGFQLVQLG